MTRKDHGDGGRRKLQWTLGCLAAIPFALWPGNATSAGWQACIRATRPRLAGPMAGRAPEG